MRQAPKPPWRAIALRLSCLCAAVIVLLLLSAALSSREEASAISLLKKKHKEPEDPTQPEVAISLINYTEWYESLTSSSARIAAFVALVVWLVFLFAFVGITASDFFSPNLATLSSRLGLSEAVAGSTLLAFGNGSPDVFSTFAALRTNAGSLAVGELLGAAAFIVSFVAGSMCLVGDFKVAKHAFLRDVGFFLVAVILFSIILLDGKIARAEAGSLIVLYLCYVGTVTIGSWWHQRKVRQKELLRKIRSEYADESIEPFRDEPSSPFLAPGAMVPPTPNTRSRGTSPFYSPASSDAGGEEEEDDELHQLAADGGFTVQRIRGRARSSTSASNRPMARSSVRPSLLSAIEFRDVVNSLRAESADERTLGVFRAGERGHRRAISATFPRHQRRVSTMSTGTGDRSPAASERARKAYFGSPPAVAASREHHDQFSEEFGQAVADQQEAPLIDLTTSDRNPWTDGDQSNKPRMRLSVPEHLNGDACTWADSPVQMRAADGPKPPAIVVTDVSSRISRAALDSRPAAKEDQEPPQRFAHLRRTFTVLFPSLQSLGDKSILGVSLAVLSAPAILALTLTLPVVDEEMEGSEDTSIDEKEEEDEEAAAARHRDEHIAHRLHTHDTPSPGSFDPGLVDAGLSHLREGLNYRSVPEQAIASPPGSPVTGPAEVVTFRPSKEEVHIAHVLAIVQAAVAPFFALAVLTGGDNVRWYYFLVAAAASLLLGFVTFAIEKSGKGRLMLCFVGFGVAVLWILSIVNEVVGVLQAIGHIFGLSDAIIGLTIFAVGNSLGDLVANLTIARMGYPVMAISACYGGPMLNILRIIVGVGISGSYFIASTGKPYHIKGSWTLTTTSIALLAILITTLIVVPANGYVMTRKWGVALMASYCLLLCTNVGIELLIESRS